MNSSSQAPRNDHTIPPSSLRNLLTWNLNGLDDTFADERAEAAIFLALTGSTLDQLSRGAVPQSPPDVIVFQELTRRTFSAHISPNLRRAGFTVYPHDAPGRELFEVIAVRTPLRIIGVATVQLGQSELGRELHAVNIAPGPGTAIESSITVLTAHFDSGTESGPIRLVQAHQVASAMTTPAIFAGDTNLRTAEWDFAKAQLGHIRDVWEELGSPADLRRTWRTGDRGARFDRVWITEHLRATAMTAIGTESLPGLGTPPSDHIGLIVSFAEQAGGAGPAHR
jgi:endonuclease/exonuclease/phosphatase family metal-dependent hydrolase